MEPNADRSSSAGTCSTESSRSPLAVVGVVSIAAAVGLASYFGREEATPAPVAPMPAPSAIAPAPSPAPVPAAPAKPAQAQAGLYATYDQSKLAMAETGDVVLFFHASWCPACRAADASLSAAAVPAGLTVLKVDYDSSAELKRRYGVTSQHTFVQVDAEGNLVKKWLGSSGAAEIAAQVE